MKNYNWLFDINHFVIFYLTKNSFCQRHMYIGLPLKCSSLNSNLFLILNGSFSIENKSFDLQLLIRILACVWSCYTIILRKCRHWKDPRVRVLDSVFISSEISYDDQWQIVKIVLFNIDNFQEKRQLNWRKPYVFTRADRLGKGTAVFEHFWWVFESKYLVVLIETIFHRNE
jgi:hypothetical protein